MSKLLDDIDTFLKKEFIPLADKLFNSSSKFLDDLSSYKDKDIPTSRIKSKFRNKRDIQVKNNNSHKSSNLKNSDSEYSELFSRLEKIENKMLFIENHLLEK